MHDGLSAELLALATAVAVETGALLRARFQEQGLAFETKSSATDMVSEVDRAAEALAVRRILAARPDDTIVGEEGASVAGASGVSWVLDPLDGTTNYLYGIPAFAVSVAAGVDGRTTAAAVYDAARDELFCAFAGGGATLNGVQVGTRPATDLARALVGTGFGYDAARRAHQGRVMAELLPLVRDIRRGGSAALDLCWVACGRLDGYYEHGVQIWDIAAGLLIVAEAGGLHTARPLTGGGFSVAAAGPALFGTFSRALATSGAGALD